MARRKRQLLEDDDSDSSQDSDDGDWDEFQPDSDLRAERALHDDPYQRKRRKRDEEEYGTKKSDWTKAPAFVSGHKEDLKVSMEEDAAPSSADDEDNEEEVEGEGDGSEYSDESEPSRVPSPRIREEEEEAHQRPTLGGIGSRANAAPDGISSGFSKAGIGSSNSEPSVPIDSAETSGRPKGGGIGSKASAKPTGGFSGFSRGGIGSSQHLTSTPASPLPSSAPVASLPSAFRGARTQRSFVRDGTPSSAPATPLPASELAHFSKLQGTFGARMLQKMGWQAGTGLGATGEGIAVPIQGKLRPQGAGLAYKGFKEKTEQSRMEAKRRGEIVSDDEEGGKRKKSGKKAAKEQAPRSDAWKKPKKVKTRIEHKTYEQIVAEAGQEPAPNIGQIIDATGATLREVSSLADISMSSWTPSTDPTRIPEVRHNIRLIAESCKIDLDGLAREAKALEDRKKWLIDEDARLRKKVEEEAELISRLQKIHLVADDITNLSKELSSAYEADLESFTPHFYKLFNQYPNEYDRYRLDEIVVAAIAPLVRRKVTMWQPLDNPTEFIGTFRTWRRALKLSNSEEKLAQLDVYGAVTIAPAEVEKPMTPFESLLWNVWLPKVRTCINNDWSPKDPHPAVQLYETWSSFLPAFIRDNFLDQLILPKVQKAVADWNPRKDNVPLQALVFPWLPHVGLRLEDLMGDARRKVKSLLRTWAVGDEIPTDLVAWKEVFDSGDWDAMLLKYVVPKLGTVLRDDFRINPRNQNMEPLEQVLQWANIIRPSIFSQLIETEFFSKWLDVLHLWLIQPKVSFEEVAQWYSFWKGSFPEEVQNMSGVANGFTRGLQLMNKAIELGPDAPTRLPRPDHNREQPQTPVIKKNGTQKARSARTQEITFRSIVEEFAASHNLLFVPTGRAHEKARMPLFRVSQTADGKGGLLVFILDDAVWAVEGDEYRAISLEDMVLKANA